MIVRNLGNIERAVRLVIGIAFAVWSFIQPQMAAVDWFIMIVALMLILNGIFSRCFFWWMLGLTTYKPVEADCD